MPRVKDSPVKDRKRILYVNHASKISGAERCMLRILENIDRERFEPILVCPDGDLASEAEARGTKVVRLKFVDYQSNRSLILGRSVPNPLVALAHALWLLSSGWRIGRIVRKSGVDLIHANTLLSRIPAYLGGIFSHTPVIWHIRDILNSGPWLALYDIVAKRGVAGIISVSNACRSQFSDQSNIWTAYDGIPTDVFYSQPERAAILRTSFGWSQQDVVFGIFGRITPWKGHERFVEAAIKVNRRFSQTRWLIVGEAWSDEEKKFEAKLKDMSVKAGLGSTLVFTGFRNDISSLMSTCDVVVVPSILPDPFPNTVLEGMSCARAVVAFAVGGIPEAMEDGVTGRLVREKTASSLALAMEEMITNSNFRQEIGLNARKSVTEKFNAKENQRSIEYVYEIILKQHT